MSSATFYGFFMTFLCGGSYVWMEGIMFTLVQIPRSTTSSVETLSLVADYVAFDSAAHVTRQYRRRSAAWRSSCCWRALRRVAWRERSGESRCSAAGARTRGVESFTGDG
jgi:hypothetical protein